MWYMHFEDNFLDITWYLFSVRVSYMKIEIRKLLVQQPYDTYVFNRPFYEQICIRLSDGRSKLCSGTWWMVGSF